MRIRPALPPLFAVLLVLIAAAPAAAQATWPTRAWPASTPAAEGLDAKALEAFHEEIAAGKYGLVDSLLVIRHGKVVFERTYPHDYDKVYGKEATEAGPLNRTDPTGPYNYFNPWWHPFYRRGDLHSLQSVTKSITSVVIGAAIRRGEFPSIETPVLSFFDPATVANVDARKQRMTLRHLLTMTAGIDWEEDVPYADPRNDALRMEASFDWVRYTIDRPMAVEPGTRFKYNSGATQLLSYVFRRATGQDIEEYAAKHLFAPLGIEHYFWKRSPSGLTDTEGGLYLTPRDLAKISLLYAREGVWEGQPIVSPEWVKQSLTPAIPVADGVQYGYKWWLYPYGKDDPRLVWAGSGFGGQRPMYFPAYDLLVVVTGWNLLPDRPSLSARVTIDRILGALAAR